MKLKKLLLSIPIAITISSCTTTSSITNEPVESGQEKEFSLSLNELFDISRASLKDCDLSIEDEKRQDRIFTIVGSGGMTLVSWGSLTRVLGIERDLNKSVVKIFTRARYRPNEWATNIEYSACIFNAIDYKIQNK